MIQFHQRLSDENHLGDGPAYHSMSKIRRTSSISDTEIDEFLVSDCDSLRPECLSVYRSRSNTYSYGDIRGMKGKYRSDSNLLQTRTLPPDSAPSLMGSQGSAGSVGREGFVNVGEREREVELLTFSSPRLFQRRGGVVGDLNVGSIQRLMEDGEQGVKVIVEEEKGGRQVTETVPADQKPLREVLDYIFIKHDLEVDWDPPTHSFTVVARNGTRTSPDLDLPSHHFSGGSLEIRPLQRDEEREEREEREEGSSARDERPIFKTLEDCLSYFTTHGLVELPSQRDEDEEEYHLPRVHPLDNIPGSWDDLPIKPELKKSLSQKQASQQRAIWELISTEYSHIKQLEVIINLFMQCGELVRRANVMSRDNYHNVFGGYMEELYAVHDQFWSWTLWPCLEQVYISGKPLDLSIIIQRFPEFSTDFEIYEQHCALDAVNLRNLNKAMTNKDFQTYLEWCEAHPVCQRRKLKDFLVIPMQRLTKYPLLFNAILKETIDSAHHEQLEQICSEVDSFVQSVNTVLVAQTETERVRDAMSRIVSFSAVDIPGEYRELMQPYTHLDLLTPMPDVEMDQPRVLMLEGNLKFRDTSSKMVAHVFLFTDLLLITRAKKGGEKFNIERPPYQISSLVLHPLEGGSFLVLVLSQYRVMTSWFTLKASTDAVATEWMQTISHAQKCYTWAVEKKAQYCKVLQSLKTSRILNGLEIKSPRQSQGSGLLSRPSLSPPRRSPTTSTESLDHAHHHKLRPLLPFELRPTQPIPMCRSRSADQTRYKFHSNPALTQIRLSDPLMGWPGFLSTSSQWLERTSSLKTLIERPESGFGSPAGSTNQLLSPHSRSHSMDHTQFPPLPPRNSSLPQQQAPPSPDSSESEVNIQETTDAIPPDFDVSSTEERFPSLAAGRRRAIFGKCQSMDEDVYRPERQGKVNEDEEERGNGNLVMVTPPTPSRPSPRKSVTAFSSANKTPNSIASQVITGNKPLQRMMHGRKGSIDSAVARETGSAHPTKHSNLPSLTSLKTAIQNRRNAHKSGKQNTSPGTSPPQKKRANKSSHAHKKSRDYDSAHSALSKLGGATLAILCAVNEGEGEGREEEGEGKEEVHHSVIPTSESDTDSLSSSPRTLVVECINDITNLSEENQHNIDATNTSESQNLKSDDTTSQRNPTKNDDREQNEDKNGKPTQGGRVRESEVRSGPPIILISQFSMSSSASSESELSQSSDKKRGFSPPPVLVEEPTAAVGGEPTGIEGETDCSRGVCEEEKVGEGGSREGSTEEWDGTDKSEENAFPRGTEVDEILCVEERTEPSVSSSSAFSITSKTSESRHNTTRENHSRSLSTSERKSSPEAQSISPSPLTNTLTTCSETDTPTQLSFNHDNQSLEPPSPSSLPPPSENPSATLPPPTNKPNSNNPKTPPPINKAHESPTTTSEATTSSPNTGTKQSPIPTTPILPKPSKKQDSSKPNTFHLQKKTHVSPTGTSSEANDVHSTARKPRNDGPGASKTSQPVSESSDRSITGTKSRSPPNGDPGTSEKPLSEATETPSSARKYRSNNSAGNSRTTAHHSATDSPRTARKTRNEAARKGVRELSKLFENGDTTSAAVPHQVIRKSRSTTTGLNLHLSSYNNGRILQNGSHNNSHQDGSHSSNGQSIHNSSHDDSGRSVRSGSHDDSRRSVRSGSNDDSGRSIQSGSNDDSGRSIRSGSHDDSGRSLRVESNLKKSVSASHLHQWVGQSERERAESTRSSLPPVSESMRVVAKKDRAASLDDLLTPRPLPSLSLSVVTTIRNSVVQVQTITDNYLLPRQLENKQQRVVTSGPVRRRKDPIPIPVQNRMGEQELTAATTEEILNNGQLRQRQELNNYRSRPTEPKLDHGRPKNDKRYTVQTQLVPKNKNDNQTISPPCPPQTHQNRPKLTKIDHRLPNGDHSPQMVKDLAAKFGGSEVKRDTVPNHSRPSLPDHTQNCHAQSHTQHGVESESFAFMGVRVYTATGRRLGGGEEGREGRERVGGGGEGERREEGGRGNGVRGRPSLERGRRVTKDHRPKVSRTDNSNGNNNTRKPVSPDLSRDQGSPDSSRDSDHTHPVGKTIVDKYGILRTMC